MAWPHNPRPAKSLVKLLEQINAAHPNRSKKSDGLLGDQAHAARKSEHNPDHNGVVRAIDITHDPANGVDGHVLSRQLVTDPRTYYVIFAGEIFKSRTGKWEAYRGPNRHDKHVHISVVADAGDYDDTAPWSLAGTPRPIQRSTLRFGDSGSAVLEAQKKLGIEADGKFGPLMLEAVKTFQRNNNLSPDGILGSQSNSVLFKEE